MKKILVLLSLFVCFNGFGQIKIDEQTTSNGIQLGSCYVHIVTTSQTHYNIDSAYNVLSIDTIYTIYAQQYASLLAYLQGKNAIQIDQLIDSYTFINSEKKAVDKIEKYKEALIIKNPSWTKISISSTPVKLK